MGEPVGQRVRRQQHHIGAEGGLHVMVLAQHLCLRLGRGEEQIALLLQAQLRAGAIGGAGLLGKVPDERRPKLGQLHIRRFRRTGGGIPDAASAVQACR